MEGTDENCESTRTGRQGSSCGTFRSPGLSESPAELEQSIDLQAHCSSNGKGQKLPLEYIDRVLLAVIERLDAGDGNLTGFEMDVSRRRNAENTAMDKERKKFDPPGITDLTGEAVENISTATPTRKKEGHRFVPPMNVIDLTDEEESGHSDTSVKMRLDQESPEAAGRERYVVKKLTDIKGDYDEDTSGTSMRLKQEPPKEAGQLLQSPLAENVGAESQGDSEAAENWPQATPILSDGNEDEKYENRYKWGPSMRDEEDDDEDEKYENRYQWGPSMRDKEDDDNSTDVLNTSKRENEEASEGAVKLLQSPVAKSMATGIPPVSPHSWTCQRTDSIGSQEDLQAAVHSQGEIVVLSDDDGMDNDEKRFDWQQSPQEVDILGPWWKQLSDAFTSAGHPRGLTEEETVHRPRKRKKVDYGEIESHSSKHLPSTSIDFVKDANPRASFTRSKGNHGYDLLLNAGSEQQLRIQCQVEHLNEPMQVESPLSEDADKAAGHQEASFTPVVGNFKSPASVKQQNGNHGVAWHPPMEAVQHVSTPKHVEFDGHKSDQEFDGHKSGQLERKSGKPGKRVGSGEVERKKNGKGKALAEEDLEEDEVNDEEEEEEECGKIVNVEDPDITETLRSIVAEKVDYEPYVRERCPEEEDPLDDDFSALRMRFMTGSSGQSSHMESSKVGTGACNHRNFDFDDVMGYYCGDCGSVGIEMPMSECDPQNQGCLHKNFEFSHEDGIYCQDCGKVWQDIQNIYKADTQRKGSGKQVQMQDIHKHELPQVQVTLQGCRGNDDLQAADLELHPSFEENLFPHQKKGFKFLTENLLGAQQEGHESLGCALAHAPGTGKTRLVVSFIQSFLTRFPQGKPLILAPAIMLPTWKDQFESWMVSQVPIYTLGGCARDQDEEDASMAPQVKTPIKEIRALELREWQKGRSILLLSYNLFQRLVSNGLGDRVLPNSLDDQITKVLRESANLVILDEGHIARNEDSLVTRAVLALETKRRVLLSGTLFQNNFEELFTLLKICRDDFMRNDPEYGKKILEYGSGISNLQRKSNKEIMQIEKKIFMEEIGNRLENWEKSGETCTDDIESVIRKFNSLTSPFVDLYPGEILKKLPGLIEHSVHLNLTTFQSEDIINGLVNSEEVKNHMSRHHKITAACIHPSLVHEEAGVPDSTRNLSPLGDEACKGVKISFTLQLMEYANIAKEKLIVFCSTLRPLTYIEDICCKLWGWCKGQQILRLDGDMSEVDRQKAIQVFNDDKGSQSKVLLASTFACKEGISLVGASRVVILDCLDNPSVIRQAVSRAFRMGQKKKVYVYRLVTTHSYEVQVFRRSVSKEKLSLVLFDEVSTISNVGKFLQEQSASDIKDELLRNLMLDDRANGRQINSVQMYNAGGQVTRR